MVINMTDTVPILMKIISARECRYKLNSHSSKLKITCGKCNNGERYCIMTAYNGEYDFTREIRKSILEKVIFELRGER